MVEKAKASGDSRKGARKRRWKIERPVDDNGVA